jgi:RimJ/RimL family protein N-acetyltransferase
VRHRLRRTTVAAVLLLTTPRTELRHWCDDDLTAYLDLYSRWDVMRWLGPQPRRVVEDEDEASRRLRRWVRLGDELDPPFGLWALVPRGGERGRGPPAPAALGAAG